MQAEAEKADPDDAIRELLGDGLSWADIAERLDVTQREVGRSAAYLACDMRANGYSVADIAAHICVHKATVRRWLHEHGDEAQRVTRAWKQLTGEERRAVVSAHEAGEEQKSIAARLAVSARTVHRILRVAGRTRTIRRQS